MFAINRNGHVVWEETGERVTYDEAQALNERDSAEYGRLCVRAIDEHYEPERIKRS